MKDSPEVPMRVVNRKGVFVCCLCVSVCTIKTNYSAFVSSEMGSSSKRGKDNGKVSKRGKKTKSTKAKSGLSTHRKKHPNDTAKMIGERKSESSDNGEDSDDNDDDDDNSSNSSEEDEPLVSKPKAVGKVSARDRLNNHLNGGTKKVVAEKRHGGGRYKWERR